MVKPNGAFQSGVSCNYRNRAHRVLLGCVFMPVGLSASDWQTQCETQSHELAAAVTSLNFNFSSQDKVFLKPFMFIYGSAVLWETLIKNDWEQTTHAQMSDLRVTHSNYHFSSAWCSRHNGGKEM